VRTIIDMVNMTRLDLRARHHRRHAERAAPGPCTTPRTGPRFGAKLIDQPAMVNVLADLAIETEAALTVALRLAGAVDRGGEQEALFRRLALAVTKYWVCKRGPAHAAEALECLGGNGYVEESGMPAPLPRDAATVHLGGFGQRGRPGRVAPP